MTDTETALGAGPSMAPPPGGATDDTHARLFGGSAAMRDLALAVRDVARVDGPVLIEGERGVCAAEIAAAIHRLSARRKGPYVRLDCAALPPDLLEAELFGREGESGASMGKLEAAHRGT